MISDFFTQRGCPILEEDLLSGPTKPEGIDKLTFQEQLAGFTSSERNYIDDSCFSLELEEFRKRLNLVVFATLEPRQGQILLRYFELGTYKKVAREIGVRPQEIFRIVKRNIAKLQYNSRKEFLETAMPEKYFD